MSTGSIRFTENPHQVSLTVVSSEPQQLAKEVHQLAHAFPNGLSDPEALRQILGRYLSPYRVESRRIRDALEQTTPVFAAVAYLNEPGVDGKVLFDNVAVAMEVHASLTKPTLLESLQKIRQLKTLKRSIEFSIPAPVCVVFAQKSDLSLEDIADVLDQVCEDTPGEHWADAVCVLHRGLVSYAVQFPREKDLAGDYFFSSVTAGENNVPPFYLIRVLKPSGAWTLNRLLAFVTARCDLALPRGKLPSFQRYLDGAPAHAMVHTGYQYVPGGKLARVPPDYYIGRHVPMPPFLISDTKGKVIGSLQFVPWQTGGVIVTERFPLEPVFVFLGAALPGKSFGHRQIHQGDCRFSYVLPITRADFLGMLGLLQARSSGLKIASAAEHVINQKIADEGTSTPFVARIMLGVFKLRDLAFGVQGNQTEFDRVFESVLSGLSNVRALQKEIVALWSGHTERIRSGAVVKTGVHGTEISESIDRELREKTESLINTSVRVLKNGMQELTQNLGCDIGFLFQKSTAFAAALEQLKQSDPTLAAYLQQARGWTEPLIDIRNQELEHGTWVLPRVQYAQKDGVMTMHEPQVRNWLVTKFATHTLDRILCFAEEVTAHCLQRQMPEGISFVEVPLPARAEEAPERFSATLLEGGKMPWSLTYHESSFDEV